MYEILYQRVFSELDRRENSFKQNLTPDTNNVSATFYQNGFGEDDGAFKDDGEDNTGWTEVKSRSSKGWLPSRGGGGGTPIHYLYWYVPPKGVVILKVLI